MRLLTRRHDANPFAGYVAEILAVEGFLGVDAVDVTARPVTSELLSGQDLVLVAQMPLDAGERAALSEYARGGGRLIMLRPPPEMAPLFGLTAQAPVLKRGHYLQWDAEGCPPGALSTDLPLQVHAEADCYATNGAAVAAWFCWGNGARRHYPAATIAAAGKGMAAMLAFDLARSTVFHHQGLPEQASTGSLPDPGALGQHKPDGHFVGHLDVTRARVPQADLQQRLLGALVDRMLPAPVPRLWYFPDGEPGLAFLNGDSDGMRLADLEGVLALIEPRGGRYTCYVMDEAPLPPEAEAALRARGHSFGKHLWAGPMPSLDQMARAVEEQIGGFRRRYGYTPLSNRGHCLIWTGWAQMAGFLARAGVRMDSNFVGCHCGHGYLTGSGLPVKFMDERGTLIDLYEQSTQWEDDVALAQYFEQLPYERAVELSLETLREARERYHTVANFNFHPIHIREEHLDTGAWIRAVAEYCGQRHIPMIGGDDWARFNDARRRVTLTGYTVDRQSAYAHPGASVRAAQTILFTLVAPDPVAGLTLTLPAAWDGAALRAATMDGAPLPIRRHRIHAADRAFLPLTLPAGSRATVAVTYGGDGG